MFRTTYKNNYSMLILGMFIGGVAGCMLSKTVKFKTIKRVDSDINLNDCLNNEVNENFNNMSKDEKKKIFEDFKDPSDTDLKNKIDEIKSGDS